MQKWPRHWDTAERLCIPASANLFLPGKTSYTTPENPGRPQEKRETAFVWRCQRATRIRTPTSATPPGGLSNTFLTPRTLGIPSLSPWNASSYLPWWPPVSWSPASGRACAWKSAPGPGARSVSASPKVFHARNFSSGGGSGSSELWWGRCSSYPWGNWEWEYHTVRREQGSDQNILGVLLQSSKRSQIPAGFSSGRGGGETLNRKFQGNRQM